MQVPEVCRGYLQRLDTCFDTCFFLYLLPCFFSFFFPFLILMFDHDRVKYDFRPDEDEKCGEAKEEEGVTDFTDA